MAPDLPRSVTGEPLASTEEGKPPVGEIGAQVQSSGGPGGWAAFLDEAEYVPELTFPGSVLAYHRMRSDTQIEALHLGTVQPVREYRWMIDPNKADSKLVERAATDLGLPIKGEEADEGVKRARGRFDFDTWLQDALLGPLYGFMHFEIVGRIEELDWRMSKLAPRHPRTIQQFRQDEHGELLAIKQNFAPNFSTIPAPIPASKLLKLVWRPEAGSHVGRSMLRSMYREWLVKERTVKIAVVNLERAGGVPVIEGPQGASNKQLAELGTMARQFRVAEGGGGAIPFGSKLTLAGGSVPDAISLLTYCDEAMARVWALMLIQLGQTATGSRALGGEFAIYAARAQRLMGKWICEAVNNFLDRYTEWNDPLADYAPMLAFEPSRPEGLAVTDLVSLLDAGAITADPELEAWLRAEFALPEKPEAPKLADLTPEEQALIENARNPPAPGVPGAAQPGSDPFNPAFHATPKPSKTLDPTANYPTLASAGTRDIPRIAGGIRASLTLPDRELRRLPTQGEIRAAVDFRTLDGSHQQITSALHHDYINGTLPTQIGEVADQYRNGTKAADLKAPVVRVERLEEHLRSAAESGVQSAVREAQVQGVHVTPAMVEQARTRAVARAEAQAEHVATLNANGLSLGAQRRAGRLAAKVGGRERVAKDLEAHLTGQKHVFERENLKGAVTVAQNAGRLSAMDVIAPEAPTASYEASEILDNATCGPCEAIDGTTYDSVEEAEADYPAGGYSDCEGGPNCRGTIVAVYPEQNPVGGEGDLREAEPAYNGEDPRGDEGGGAAIPEPEPTPGGEGAIFDASGLGDVSAGTSDGVALAEEAVGQTINLDRPVPVVLLPDSESASARLLTDPPRIGVTDSPYAKPEQKAYDVAHETGHYVDRYVLGDGSEFSNYGDPLYQAMKNSPTMQALRNDEFALLKGDEKTRNYYLQGREMFARAFAQLTAERSDSESLKALLARQQADEHLRLEVWQRDEFIPIRAELERVLDEKGVLRGDRVELAPPEAPAPPPPEATAPAGPTDGPLLAEAKTISTHDEALGFLKDRLGIKQVDLGGKLARAAAGSGQQAEHAMTVTRGIVESIADARDTFGADATHIDAVFTTSGAKASGESAAAREGIGAAHAAVRTLENPITRDRWTHLVVNDVMSLADMAATDLHETSDGFVAKATTDVGGRIMHEMGHVLEDNLPGFTMQLPRMLADSGLASTAQQRGVARFVSTYATTKTVETWAESFATLMRHDGIADDFSFKTDSANLQVQRMAANADADTKAALAKLRDGFNAWAAETYPNLPHIPER